MRRSKPSAPSCPPKRTSVVLCVNHPLLACLLSFNQSHIDTLATHPPSKLSSSLQFKRGSPGCAELDPMGKAHRQRRAELGNQTFPEDKVSDPFMLTGALKIQFCVQYALSRCVSRCPIKTPFGLCSLVFLLTGSGKRPRPRVDSEMKSRTPPPSSTITCPIRDLRKYYHPSLSLLTNTLDRHLLSADHVSWNGNRVNEWRN